MDYLLHPNISALNTLVKSNPGIAAFIGAGCSAVLKIPLWDDMLIKLNDKFKYYPTSSDLKDDIRRSGYPKVASNIKSKAPNEQSYKDLITKFSQPSACYFTSLHIELISASKLIITTNYDHSFEETYNSLQRFDKTSDSKYVTSSLGKFSHQGWGVTRHIFHLHGEATSGDVILTYESYAEQYKNKHSGVANLIDTVFSGWSTLFVGFSFEDQFFVSFLKESFESLKAEKLRYGYPFPKHYCILSDKLKKDYLTTEDLISNNIKIDTLLSENIILEDRTLLPGQTVFRFQPNILVNINRTGLDSKIKEFVVNQIKQIDSNNEKLKLLAELEIEILFFEGDQYLQIEYILREVNKPLPGISASYTPN